MRSEQARISARVHGLNDRSSENAGTYSAGCYQAQGLAAGGDVDNLHSLRGPLGLLGVLPDRANFFGAGG
jgi:hypothetical protein